jgi:hypothetical protein
MCLADYFADEPEPPETLSDTELAEYLQRYATKLNAFLTEAENDPETDPEELLLAQQMLDDLVCERASWELACVEVERTERELAQAQKNAKSTLDALTDEQLRLMLRYTEQKHGWGSKEYRQLADSIRQLSPDRLARAIDT